MKYITEINAFYDWMVTNRLNSSAVALYYALMHIANKAGWPDDFTVSISTLSEKTGCGRDAIYSARNILKQKGRITFRERRGNQCATYRIIPFVSDEPTQTTTQPPTQTPNINKTRQDKNKIPPISPKHIFSDYAKGDQELLSALEAFAEMRKAIKKPLSTDRAYRMLFRRLDALSNGDSRIKCAMLENAVLRDWQTVYPLQEDELPPEEVQTVKVPYRERTLEDIQKYTVEELIDGADFRNGA